MSIANEIQRLQTAKANMKTAIENKGVVVGDGTIDTYAEKISEISSGSSGETLSKPELWEGVNFIDYDGTIIETWTPEEVTSKTELPTPPTHEYLINDGWNWTLQTIKDYMVDCPDAYLSVGAQYKTVDSATYLFVELDKFTLNPTVSFCINGTATIDWGDGTTSEVSGTNENTDRIDTPHIYSQGGNYVIKIMSNTTIGLMGQNVGGNTSTVFWSGIDYNSSVKYANALKSVFLGNANLNLLALFNAYGLEKVVISSDVKQVNSNSFSEGKINAFVVPRQVKTIRATHLMTTCFTKLSIPDTAMDIGLATPCHIKALALPTNITSIIVYNSHANRWLSKLTISKGANITSFGNYAFYRAEAIRSINVPQKVSSIGTGCFGFCYSLEEIHFYPTTPPTVTNSNVFDGPPTTCKIYVPQGTLSAYTQATNYPDPNTYTYIEE